MSVPESTSECTIYCVIRKISLVQKMKLLFLQDVVIKGNDICINRIVNEKKLIEILEDYRDDYDDVKYHDTITIYNLEEDSLLRAGLRKQVLTFMTPYPYIDWDSGEFGKIVFKSNDNKIKEYIYDGGVGVWIQKSLN